MDFYVEKGIKTSDHKDYEYNEWDKGHMAPAADFNCTKDMLWETFTYMNCALQHQSLNRGVWKYLEARERELAKQYPTVKIKIRVVFDKKPVKVVGGASIPKGFYKEISYGNIREIYYFPNTTPESKDFNFYRVN
jgi:endonuclease G